MINSIYKNTLCLFLLSILSFSANAAERIDVLAGLIPTKGGEVRVVLLTNDKPVESYCPSGWKYGMVEGVIKQKVGTSAITGCWSSETNPAKFKYFDPQANRIFDFSFAISSMKPYKYDYMSDTLFLK